MQGEPTEDQALDPERVREAKDPQVDGDEPGIDPAASFKAAHRRNVTDPPLSLFVWDDRGQPPGNWPIKDDDPDESDEPPSTPTEKPQG